MSLQTDLIGIKDLEPELAGLLLRFTGIEDRTTKLEHALEMLAQETGEALGNARESSHAFREGVSSEELLRPFVDTLDRLREFRPEYLSAEDLVALRARRDAAQAIKHEVVGFLDLMVKGATVALNEAEVPETDPKEETIAVGQRMQGPGQYAVAHVVARFGVDGTAIMRCGKRLRRGWRPASPSTKACRKCAASFGYMTSRNQGPGA